MKKYSKVVSHVIPWTIYYSLPYIVNYFSKNPFFSDFNVVWTVNTVYHIGVFYVFFFYVNPRFLKKDQLFKYFGISLGMLILLSLGKLLIYMPVNLALDVDTRKFPYRFMEAFFLGGIFAVLAIFINFMTNWFKSQQLKAEMEKQKMESELNMLKYQVNPHFLFNTLNNIYSLVMKKSDRAPEAVLKLSNLMRYMIYETNEQRVALKRELEYIVHFIELQKMRMKYPEIIDYHIYGEPDNKMIAPMLLIPFIENAFKHALKSPDHTISITINIANETLAMQTSNTIDPKQKTDKLSGIGLKNVRKRLELDYPGKHSLSIYRQEAKFYVDLMLNLDEPGHES
jgi:hypothetical protein